MRLWRMIRELTGDSLENAWKFAIRPGPRELVVKLISMAVSGPPNGRRLVLFG